MDDEAQVRVDHALLRRAVAALDLLGELDLLGRSEQLVLAELVHEQVERVDAAGSSVEGEVETILLALAVVPLDDRGDVSVQGELNSFPWSALCSTPNARSVFHIGPEVPENCLRTRLVQYGQALEVARVVGE
jgi:hypothetical protein